MPVGATRNLIDVSRTACQTLKPSRHERLATRPSCIVADGRSRPRDPSCQGVDAGVPLVAVVGMLSVGGGGTMLLSGCGTGAMLLSAGAGAGDAASVVLQADSASTAMADAASSPRRSLSFMGFPLFCVGRFPVPPRHPATAPMNRDRAGNRSETRL